MHDQQNKQKIGNRTKGKLSRALSPSPLLDPISTLSPVTFELFSRPPYPIFSMHTLKYAKHKKCAARSNFAGKVYSKGKLSRKVNINAERRIFP